MRVGISSLVVLATWLAGGELRVTAAHAQDDCTGARIDWRFRAASPISPPIAADGEGRVFVATHEGYVHGIAADGRFLFSYSTSGGLLFGVTLDETGRIYTTSTDGRVWALASDGTARWVFQAPLRADSPLVVGPKHAATFVTGASMHAVSSRAGLLWGVPLGGNASGVPLLGPLGETWVATRNGWLHAVETPFRKRRWRVAELSIDLLAVSRRTALVRVETAVRAVDTEGNTLWSREGVERAAVDQLGAERGVLVHSQALEFVALETGTETASVAYAERVSASPLLLAERAYVPREDGRLDVVEATGLVGSCRLGDSALFAPIIARDRIVVADASGAVTSIVLQESR